MPAPLEYERESTLRFLLTDHHSFFVVHAWNFYLYINTVKDGTGGRFLVFGHQGMRTGPGLLAVPVIATRAGMYTVELCLRSMVNMCSIFMDC
jgi:hypothetical protein